MVNESVSHHVVKSLAWLSALGAPPEPATVGFMKGSPENWYSSVFEFLELNSNGIKISESIPVLAGALSDCLPNIEPSALSVEGAGP